MSARFDIPARSSILIQSVYVVSESGTFVYHGIGEVLVQYINQFPVQCWMDLDPFRPAEGVGVTEGNFTMISVNRAPNSFQISTTFINPTTTTIPTTTTPSSTISTSISRTVLSSTP